MEIAGRQREPKDWAGRVKLLVVTDETLLVSLSWDGCILKSWEVLAKPYILGP